MTIFFSPSSGGFYSDDIHGDNRPADAVAISASHHRHLLAGQARGRAIIARQDGRPALARLQHATLADRRATAIRRVKRQAAKRIEAVAPLWRQLNDLRAPGPGADARFAAIDAIRAASAVIEREITAANATELAALDVAAHAAWPKDA